MRILVLCYEYPPLGGGGGRAAKSVAEEMVRRGHEVRVQTSGMPHLPARETIGGVEVCRTHAFRRHEESCTPLEMGFFLVTSFWPTLRHVRGWRPQVIHAHFAVPTGALAWAVAAVTSIPYVLTVQLGDVPGGVPEQTDRLFKWLKPATVPIWRGAAAITVVSEFVKRLATAAYGLPVVKIPNGVPLGDEPVLRVGKPVALVAVGRFNPQKNFLFLMEALARVADLDWTFMLIGDGPQRDAIRTKIDSLGLASRVRLVGWLEGAEVERTLAESDVFLMPSTSEGLSVAAVEALKHGLAMLGSDIGGLWDLIEPGVNGHRIAVDDLASFASRLRELLTEPETILRMKIASREKAREFDLAVIGGRYEEVLARAARDER